MLIILFVLFVVELILGTVILANLVADKKWSDIYGEEGRDDV